MCGIAGEIDLGAARLPREWTARAIDAQSARGPDGEGVWDCGWAVLGHRRLSIVDLSDRGAQPMVDETTGTAITFNGCIYNHDELRRELSRDLPFRSLSDTEVILKGYRRWGDRVVDHLVGMFAFVIVDRRRKRVVMARDRLGIKPLYLSPSGSGLRFASTVPALIAGGGVDTSVDPVGLHHYLSWHSIVPGEHTILAGVQKLPPATVRVIEHGRGVTDRVYWQPGYERDSERSELSPDDWLALVHDSLRQSVRRRLAGDVPVGVLLSGGLDSSLLVALLASEGRGDIPTFSIGFDAVEGTPGDEFAYSDVVARTYATDHHRIRVTNSELASALDGAVAAMSEPQSTHDATAFYLLGEAVGAEHKVVLSGQGADEVFAGYRYHQDVAGAARADAFRALSAAFTDYSDAALRSLVRAGRLPDRDVSADLLRQHLDAPGAETSLDAVLRADVHLLMPDDPVKRIDNMLMASGVEARVPFLDHDLVELAAACPPEAKTAQGGKGILKELARRLLPAEVIDRRKGYFPVPQFRHLSGDVLRRVEETLRSPEAKARGLFDESALNRLLDRPNDSRTKVGGNVLWNLAVLELWLQHHVDAARPGAQPAWGSSRTTRTDSSAGSAASGITMPASMPLTR
jgi:asparagine synthase (glutamine-hydrolysing)